MHRTRWFFTGLAVALLLGFVVVGLARSDGAQDHATHGGQPRTPLLPEHTPSYDGDIRPLLAEHCLSCHVAGGIAPFSLEMPETARALAPRLAEVTVQGVMPPWPPGPATPPLVGERKLTDEEIGLLVAWAEAGAPLGQGVATPPPAPPREALRPDLVLSISTPYTPDPALKDDYRCFLLEPELEATRFVTAYDIRPDRRQQVHHVLLFPLDGSLREAARARDAESAAPGWPCFGGPNLGSSSSLADPGAARSAARGLGMAWAPGASATRFPEGTGMALGAGDILVMQVHYNLRATPEPDLSAVVLELADPDAAITPLTVMPLFAPVEIPCPAGSDGPACDRRQALRQAVREDGRRALLRTQGLLALCGASPEDYLYQDAARVTSSCDRPIPHDGFAVGVMGHMHTRGRSLRITLHPEGPEVQILLDIPAWDFHWQGSYLYETPIPVRAGDAVRISCVWDNTQETPPRYILWGEGTQDEMCLGALLLKPAP